MTSERNRDEALHGIKPDDVIPDEEEQREVMLRQLAEQRARMRAEGEATPEADQSIGEPVEQELERTGTEGSDPPPREPRREL